MYAEVHLTLDRRNRVLSRPSMRSKRRFLGQQVVVITSHAQPCVEIRKVQLGMETATKVEVGSG